MHQTLGTDTGPRWELRARVASSVLFGAGVVGLFLPWDRSEARTGLDILLESMLKSSGLGWYDFNPAAVASAVIILTAPVVGLALGLRRTRRAAIARAVIAAAGTAPFAFGIWVAFGLTGRPPDIMAGWVTFWALVGAFITNVVAARLNTNSHLGRGSRRLSASQVSVQDGRSSR